MGSVRAGATTVETKGRDTKTDTENDVETNKKRGNRYKRNLNK